MHANPRNSSRINHSNQLIARSFVQRLWQIYSGQEERWKFSLRTKQILARELFEPNLYTLEKKEFPQQNSWMFRAKYSNRYSQHLWHEPKWFVSAGTSFCSNQQTCDPAKPISVNATKYRSNKPLHLFIATISFSPFNKCDSKTYFVEATDKFAFL